MNIFKYSNLFENIQISSPSYQRHPQQRTFSRSLSKRSSHCFDPPCWTRRMPRTASKRRPKGPDKEPIDVYDRLEYHKQLICWNYYQYTATSGEIGWNPSEAGSVYHQERSSAYITSLGSDSWFRHLGRQMATLAEKFALRNQVPTEPKAPGGTSEESDDSHHSDGHSLQEYYQMSLNRAARGTSPAFPSLSPRTPVTAPCNNVAGTPSKKDKVSYVTFKGEEYPPLSLPIAFGQYESFYYTSRTSIEHIMVRILVHNAVELQDVDYDWITPRVLKLQIAWPEWFVFAEQMAAFATDEDGDILFPPDQHAMTQSMARRNWDLADKTTSRVYDEGYIKFEKDIKQDTFKIERLNIDIPSKGTTVRGIQFFVQ